MQQSKIFIAVAGNIGTGKTTLTRMLSERFGWEPHYEAVVDNPYLEDFYKDMNRWSFPLQIFFLNNRFRAHQKIAGTTNSAIQDRSIYEDFNIFARNLVDTGKMDARDFKNYFEIYESFCEFLAPPDVVVYLRKSLPRLQSQILKRGRSYEANIPPEYLAALNRYYDDWMKNYSYGKKLIIDTDELDFVQNPADFDLICQKIVECIDQRDLFLNPLAPPRSQTPANRILC